MKKLFALLLACMMVLSLAACAEKPAEPSETTISTETTTAPTEETTAPAEETTAPAEKDAPVEIKVLILPKFESGEMAGDFPGEAQYYYEAYCMDGEEYDVVGSFEDHKLYVKDGIALYVTGMGKVNTALSLANILTDSRFDFSDAYILSTGCAGSAYGSTVMGDVVLGTATVDFDLGHHADIRDLSEGAENTWFYDSSYDSASYKIMDEELMNKIFELVKDIPMETTEGTKAFMAKAFDNADWATRDPMVLRGTIVTGDNYWKGMYDHANAIAMTQQYGCPDPFAITEMEDNALAVVADRMGMLDRFIVLRDSVNMDVFMNGATAEQLWDPNFDESLASPESTESADIFATAMKNNFAVGSVIIEAILNGTL